MQQPEPASTTNEILNEYHEKLEDYQLAIRQRGTLIFVKTILIIATTIFILLHYTSPHTGSPNQIIFDGLMMIFGILVLNTVLSIRIPALPSKPIPPDKP